MMVTSRQNLQVCYIMPLYGKQVFASVVELEYTTDLKSVGASHMGSSPITSTNIITIIQKPEPMDLRYCNNSIPQTGYHDYLLRHTDNSHLALWGWVAIFNKMERTRKFGPILTRILANPDIKALAKIVLRNELKRYIKSSKGGKPKNANNKIKVS